MATNFSSCKGSYVLNQFPSNVMFGMNGFHVSASGAIQGHHGPLVSHLVSSMGQKKKQAVSVYSVVEIKLFFFQIMKKYPTMR